MIDLPRNALAAMAVLAAFGAAPAAAESGHGGMVTLKDGAAVQWGPAPPSLPQTMGFAVIAGDPSKPGPFALRVKLPPNTVIKPHTHPTPETLTVISGRFMHDHGETLEKSRGVEVGTGGFVFLPADMAHSLWTDGEETVLQVNGTGPFTLKYVNPADDPSGQGK